MITRLFGRGLLSLLILIPSLALAQTGPSATPVEPFKLGTFQIQGVPKVGIVLRDQYIIDLEVANRDLEINPMYPRIPMPADMIQLIGQYEYGLKYRLYELVNHLVASNRVTGAITDCP